jgi:putative transposase
MARRAEEPAPGAKLIELQSAYEEPMLKAVGDIDLDRMINNIITENGGYDDE